MYEFGGYLSASLCYEDNRYIRTYEYIGGNDVYAEIVRYGLFDIQKGTMVLDNCDSLNIYALKDDTYIAAVKDNCSALYNAELDIIRKNYFE